VRDAEAETSDLIQRARRGDPRAFDELVARHERRVWSLAYQIAGNPDDAREVTQEVFLKVHQHLDGYDTKRPFASWLYRITVNCSYDYIKKRPAHAPLATAAEPDRDLRLADAAAGPERLLADRELRAALRGQLHHLTPQERTVFVLRDLEGMATREIAYVLRCTAITVRRHSSNARLKLREGIVRRYPHLLPGGGQGEAEE
jgi:RNA polymerase sigma-70 factor (ECF subfamily)